MSFCQKVCSLAPIRAGKADLRLSQGVFAGIQPLSGAKETPGKEVYKGKLAVAPSDDGLRHNCLSRRSHTTQNGRTAFAGSGKTPQKQTNAKLLTNQPLAEERVGQKTKVYLATEV